MMISCRAIIGHVDRKAEVRSWIHPSCGGGMKAYPEYERAERESKARMKKGKIAIEDLVQSYEYCSWERAGNSEKDYP